MASYNKINDFVEDVAEGVHNLESDTLTVALSDTTPASESSDPSADGNGVLSNVTEISYTNCTDRTLTVNSSSVSSGTYELNLADKTLNASGGSVGPFQYVYIYNDTAGSDQLISYYDYGSSVTLNDGDSFDIDFDQASGFLTIS